jgi:D-serine deaminase-like pyridoxal phosphate-dependent protein
MRSPGGKVPPAGEPAEDQASIVGRPKSELDTPALCVDLDTMEANIERIVATCRRYGVGWRPHCKSHKSPDIARKLMASGAIGITCAKLSEAEIMAANGIDNIIIANQTVGARKIERLLALTSYANLVTCVDGLANLEELNAAFASVGRALDVAIEVDIGMGRAGVEPGVPVLALLDEIVRRPGLRFVGLLGWESQTTTIADPSEKQRAVADAIARLTDSARLCRDHGHPAEMVSCGGTGTFPYCIMQPGVTEVQVGGAIFGDLHYRNNYHVDIPCALTILATVTSRPNPKRIIADAGLKALSVTGAPPAPVGLPVRFSLKLSSEHATIELTEPFDGLRVGDRIEFLVGYSDTTIHLHRSIVGVRGGVIECVWPVAARAALT